MQSDHKSAESMRAYLLGQLSDHEAAALEEQYFVNRDCFLRIQSEENALIADYLDDSLPKSEKDAFETRYLHVPELERKVEEVRRQRNFLRSVSPPAFRVRWGLATAALAIIVALGFWARHYSKKQPDLSAQRPSVKEEPVSPVQPSQEPSVAHAHEPTPPSIMPVEPPNNKPFAGNPHFKNRSVAPMHTPVETAAINPSPPNDTGSAQAATVQRIKRVAVLDFDYGTVQSYVSSIYGSNQDVGKGITDMLVEKLVKDGKYSVIERKALDKILAEQNFSDNDRANPAMAAKIGQLLGVDAVIMGSVTKFGSDDENKSYGNVGFVPRSFGVAGVKRSEGKAVCAISARLVDANSGEILAAITSEGESRRIGTSLVGGAGSNGGGVGVFDTHAPNFAQTLLGEAVTQAVTDVGGRLGASVGSVPTQALGQNATGQQNRVVARGPEVGDQNNPNSWHEPGIYVYVLDGRARKMIKLEPTVYSRVFTSTMTYEIRTVAWKAVVRSAHANTKVKPSQSVFYFYFVERDSGASHHQFAGIDTLSDFTLLKFDVKDDSREAIVHSPNALRKASTSTGESASISFTVERVKTGIYKVASEKPLSPGEYCFLGPSPGGVVTPNSAHTNQLYDFTVE